MLNIGLNSCFFKANPKNFQVLILWNEIFKSYKLINEMYTNSKHSRKLLGVTADIKQTFRKHVNKIFKPASYKIFALQKSTTFLSQKASDELAKAFKNSHFNYWSLTLHV